MEITGKGATARKAQIGVSTGNTNVCFEKADQQSPLNLTGKAKTCVTVQRFKISTSFFKKFSEDISPFYGASDTLVLDLLKSKADPSLVHFRHLLCPEIYI